MKQFLCTFFFFVVLYSCKSEGDSLTMLVGTYTDAGSKGIYTFRFEEDAGTAEKVQEVEVQNPSFLAVSTDKKWVYAVSERRDDASVLAFDFDVESGVLGFKNSQLTDGAGPCHVTFVGREVVSANYLSGTISILPIDADGRLGESELLQFNETGPDTIRQEKSHLHSTQVTPDGKYLMAIDLGGDYIYRFPLANGRIADTVPVKIKMPLGSGPRHFDFSIDHRFMYVINELSGSVVVYEYNGGDLRQMQEIQADTLYARGSADIHVSPDGRFLYASNRLKGDGIAIFSINKADGRLTRVGYQETGVHPRNFAITPNGKFLLAACRDDNVIQVFERDQKTGLLTDTHQDISVSRPVCVIFAGKKQEQGAQMETGIIQNSVVQGKNVNFAQPKDHPSLTQMAADSSDISENHIDSVEESSQEDGRSVVKGQRTKLLRYKNLNGYKVNIYLSQEKEDDCYYCGSEVELVKNGRTWRIHVGDSDHSGIEVACEWWPAITEKDTIDLVPVYDKNAPNPYLEWREFVYFADLNFDGKDELVINSCPHAPAYSGFFVYDMTGKKPTRIRNEIFDEMEVFGQRTEFLFDRETKTIMSVGSSSAIVEGRSVYYFRNGRLVKSEHTTYTRWIDLGTTIIVKYDNLTGIYHGECPDALEVYLSDTTEEGIYHKMREALEKIFEKEKDN